MQTTKLCYGAKSFSNVATRREYVLPRPHGPVATLGRVGASTWYTVTTFMERPPPAESVKPFYDDISSRLLRLAASDQTTRAASQPEDADIDKTNTEEIRRIVSEIGWPTQSKVGAEASTAAWLLVQHADHDPAFQERCLDLMRQEIAGVRLENIAFLEDRVLVNAGRLQRYGTQFREQRDASGEVIGYDPLPIEDGDHVDERRASVGLEPLDEYRRRLTARNYPHLMKS